MFEKPERQKMQRMKCKSFLIKYTYSPLQEDFYTDTQTHKQNVGNNFSNLDYYHFINWYFLMSNVKIFHVITYF